MSIQTIYTQLIKAGLSPVGACGLMGNMQAESAMRSNNAQDGMTRMSDADYTAAVDKGTYSHFTTDSVGYGLCQWTYGARKKNMLEFHRARGKSIGDEATQVEFCIEELKREYSALWRYLCGATGVYEAAERVCKEYERPAVNNVKVRAEFANQFYMTLGGMEISTEGASPSPTAPEGEPSAGVYWPPRTLAYGMSGGDVVALQGLLTAHGHTLTGDGQYGNKTKGSVEAFQRSKGLKADGIAGNKTWDALTAR